MTVHSVADKAGDKRDRILSAAERIFARHGFFAAKVSDVAKEAGVADGTIYLYFKSKDDLLISLFERRMRQLNGALREAIAGKAPKEQLRAFIRTYLQLVHDEPAAAEVLTIELRQSAKFMKEYDNVELADFLRMLAGVVVANGVDIPAHMAARMIFGVLDEVVIAWVLAKAPFGGGTRPKKFDIVRAADWVIKLVETGLSAKEST
jgi:TetR/AcrR family transcriptional regulator, fatty acid metabolism regulator protein